MKFYKFTEHNSWEGETWAFYIPAKGNANKLNIIRLLCELKPSTYKLETDQSYTEEEVDIICANSGSGYMAYHNKVARVDLDLKKQYVAHQDPDDHLYKGRAFTTVHELEKEGHATLKKAIDGLPK